MCKKKCNNPTAIIEKVPKRNNQETKFTYQSLLSQLSFLLGYLLYLYIKDLGRIYQQTDTYAYTGYDLVKLYKDKTVTRAIDFLKTKVLPVYRQFYILLGRILSDNCNNCKE